MEVFQSMLSFFQMWAEITEPSSEKSKVYLWKNLPPYLSFSQQCLLLERRAKEDLLQGVVGKPVIARSPREAAGYWSPSLPRASEGFMWCAVLFPSMAGKHQIQSCYGEQNPQGLGGGLSKTLWERSLSIQCYRDWNLCLHKSKSLWLLAKTSKGVDGLQNLPTYLWLAVLKILIRKIWCMKWYCFWGPLLWSQINIPKCQAHINFCIILGLILSLTRIYPLG